MRFNLKIFIIALAASSTFTLYAVIRVRRNVFEKAKKVVLVTGYTSQKLSNFQDPIESQSMIYDNRIAYANYHGIFPFLMN